MNYNSHGIQKLEGNFTAQEMSMLNEKGVVPRQPERKYICKFRNNPENPINDKSGILNWFQVKLGRC